MEIHKLSEKRSENKDSKDDPESRENNGEGARNVYQRPRRTKEQTEMNNTLERISSRITEEERIMTGKTE